jgi:hypothetical protein
MLLNVMVAFSAWGKGAKMAQIEDCMDEQRGGACEVGHQCQACEAPLTDVEGYS